MRNIIYRGEILEEIYNNDLKQYLIKKFNYDKLFGFDIQKHVKLFFIPKKDHIIQDTKTPEYLFYLVKGKTKLYENLENGQVALIDLFTPACFIGEIELTEKNMTPLNVQAIEDCLCLGLSFKDLKTTLLNDAVLFRNLLSYLSHKNMRNIQVAARNQSYSLAKRLASFILMTEQNGIYDEKHTQVAQYLGVSYRHLLYVIADFVKKGYIEKEKSGYKILNLPKLKALAKR